MVICYMSVDHSDDQSRVNVGLGLGLGNLYSNLQWGALMAKITLGLTETLYTKYLIRQLQRIDRM